MATALLGSLLNTKPLVGLRDGIAYPIERIRGRQRSLDRIIELAQGFGRPAHLAVGHTTDEAGMKALALRLSDHFPCDRMLQAQCGATLGSYLGPGAFGVALIEAA
jgi:fatty acid-binding protein DegV